MCGLAFALSKKGHSAGQQVLNLYKAQENRGKQGYGFISIHEGKLVGIHRAMTEFGIRPLLLKDKSEFIMFHHRSPTSTKNTVGTTHPMYVTGEELKYDYYFAHNGIIHNASLLKSKHEEKGYKYQTEYIEKKIAEYKSGRSETLEVDKSVFNDSESLAIELARYIEGLSDEISTRGPVAFWGISLEKGSNNVVEVFFGKNKGRDLCIKDNKKWYTVSSETGQDLEDMKLYSVPIKDLGKSLFEQPLEIDEATPVERVIPVQSTTGYRWRELDDTTDYRTEDEKLVNKYYTIKEAMNVNIPFREFVPVSYGGTIFYVPMKFVGDEKDREKPSETEQLKLTGVIEGESKIIKPTLKEMERLDVLVERWAALEGKLDKAEELYTNGNLSKSHYDSIVNQTQEEISLTEDLISALNIDEEIVDEVLDTARQLVDYNNSFATYNGDTSVIID